MKMPNKKALEDIIKGMQELQLEKVSGYKKKKDAMPSIEIEEASKKDVKDLLEDEEDED